MIEYRNLSLTTLDGRQSVSHLPVEILPHPMRLKMAIKRLCFFWFLALLLVLVPVIHFVMLPIIITLFGLGPVVAKRQYAIKGRIQGGGVNCPVCQREIDMSCLKLPNFKFKHHCPNCRHELYVESIDLV